MEPMEESGAHFTVVKLHTADHLSYLRANQILKQYGLTIQQALILQFLARFNDRKINQKDIESYLGISNPSVTSLMKNMVAKKLIQRLPDRTDARSYLLRLTPRAQQLQSIISNALGQLSDEVCADLTAEEVAQLSSLLDKITKNLLHVTR